MKILTAVTALTSVLLAPFVSAETEKPNIIFIMLDDLGKEWIGCYGADDIKTPHIDALAESGLTFNKAWSMPQCTPTRVTLLTGQYPWRTGWVNHWDVPRGGVAYFDWEKHTTFATLMKSAGYKTAVAGKWQINDFRVEPEALKKHGFDDWCMWTGYEAQNTRSKNRYWDPYVHTRDGSKTWEGKFGPDIYKVWINTDREIDKFYDLQEDPGEKRNLIEQINPELKPVLEKFQSVLDAMPKVDARPQYRKRQALPWDKKPSDATKSYKKKERKRKQRS